MTGKVRSGQLRTGQVKSVQGRNVSDQFNQWTFDLGHECGPTQFDLYMTRIFNFYIKVFAWKVIFSTHVRIHNSAYIFYIMLNSIFGVASVML